MRLCRRAARWTAAMLLCGAAPASTQPFEQAGVRAHGMGGAFVAVADDASASWWNPAGLAAGPFFNLLVEYQQQNDPDDTVNAVALGTPPLGVSYQRVRYAAAAETGSRDRETGGRQEIAGPFVAHEVGLTVLQSLTADFVVGTTLKFVRGVVEDRGSNQVDLDLGLHYRAGRLRAGLVVRNVSEPSFQLPVSGELTLDRQARAGLAWTTGVFTAAVDFDLTEPAGDDGGRRLAVGGERSWTRWAVRGGTRLRTSGSAAPWGSLGGSYALKPGIWIDGFWGDGEAAGARWGISARVTY